jgi:alpha-L-rhamnosidase
MTRPWKGCWIESFKETDYCQPADYFRKEFKIEKKVIKARLYMTALGLYEPRLNGRRISDSYFTPGWTNYEKRVQYQTYDITKHIITGNNAWGVILGDGWYCGTIAGHTINARYGKQPRFLGQIYIEFSDGTNQTILTDDKWKYNHGPIIYSDIYMGEKYDARKRLTGWDKVGYEEKNWKAVNTIQSLNAKIVAQKGSSVKKIKELAPVSITQQENNKWLFDMGQNMVGWERLKVSGRRGQKLIVRHGEILNKDGSLHVDNLREAKAQSIYILNGDKTEYFEPHFTYYGFRYIEISGLDNRPDNDILQAILLHSQMEVTGKFKCSNSLINRLQSNIEWGQKGNFFDIPTDCPQRDERLGWTGDAQVFMRTAAFNMDVYSFFAKWFDDLNDSQATDGRYPTIAPARPPAVKVSSASAWSDAGIICPWLFYLIYGDSRILSHYYENMKKWIVYQQKSSCNYLREETQFGDWLNVQADTPGKYISTAFFAYTTSLMLKIATSKDCLRT